MRNLNGMKIIVEVNDLRSRKYMTGPKIIEFSKKFVNLS